MNGAQQTKTVRAIVCRLQETVPTVHTRHGVTTIPPVFPPAVTRSYLADDGFVAGVTAPQTMTAVLDDGDRP